VFYPNQSSLTPLEMTSTSSTIISTKVKGFSIYENIPHRASIQYPSAWNKHELLNNDLTIVLMFLAPVTRFFSSREDAKIRDMAYNKSSTTVLVSIKRSVAVHDTSNTLQAITNDQIRLLNICFDNVNLLETSYDRKMGEIQASKLIYTYTDPLQNHIDKKGMKIISIQGHKEIIITYSSQNQDFDKFISTVDRMVGTLRILE
jgi:hypothetical protein